MFVQGTVPRLKAPSLVSRCKQRLCPSERTGPSLPLGGTRFACARGQERVLAARADGREHARFLQARLWLSQRAAGPGHGHR